MDIPSHRVNSVLNEEITFHNMCFYKAISNIYLFIYLYSTSDIIAPQEGHHVQVFQKRGTKQLETPPHLPGDFDVQVLIQEAVCDAQGAHDSQESQHHQAQSEAKKPFFNSF